MVDAPLPEPIRFRYTRWGLSILACFLAFCVCVGLYAAALRGLDLAHQSRNASQLLALELRQSSDDLTYLARSAVATGDPRMRQAYQQVLDIRDGKAPMGVTIREQFRDLGLLTPEEAPRSGPRLSFYARLVQAGLDRDAFVKLEAAKQASEALVLQEQRAMDLAASGAKGRLEALELLHGASYIQAKARIMKPISDFLEALEARTRLQEGKAERLATWYLGAAVGFGLLLVLSLVLGGIRLRQVLGGSIQKLSDRIEAMGRGQFQPCNPQLAGNSILGWLQMAETRLAALKAERDTVEAAAHAAERRFRDIVDTTDGIVWEADARAFRYTFVSHQAERLLGYPLGAWLEPGFWLDHVHPDDRSQVVECCSVWQNQPGPLDLEYRMTGWGGRTVWVHALVTQVVEDGAVRWLRGIMVDITERKRSQQEHARIIEISRDPFLRMSLGGNILECNSATCELVGFAPEELLNASIRVLDPEASPEVIAEHMGRIIAQGHLRFERTWRHRDGQAFTMEVSVTYLGLRDEICLFARDITDLRRHERELEAMAHYDPLTGIPNRVLLADRLDMALDRVRRSGELLVVGYLDLDGFKPVNDTHGHEAGDRLLKVIALRLSDALRGGDTVARLGGDEFALVLGLASMEALQPALARILAIIEAPVDLGAGVQVHVSASLGVTVYPVDPADPEVLLRHADQAMYLAKRGGKNRVQVFNAVGAG